MITLAKSLLAAACLTPLCLSSACSLPVERHDWTSYTGPGRELFLAEEIAFPSVPDPLEPLNRASANVNHAALRFLVAPVARVYRFFVPGPVRESVQRAGTNLLYPGRLVNNVLQGNLRGSLRETQRFLINSTMGAGGLFDPAWDMGLLPSREDVGQTFARWGWDNSTYLFLPILGPSTVRDGIGEAGDALLDPLRYVDEGAPVARSFNSLTNSIEGTLRAARTNYDAYQLARLLFVRSREIETQNFSLTGDDSGEVQTLGALFLAPEDPDFYLGAQNRAVAIGEGIHVNYSLWLHPDGGSLVYVIPGFGGHRLSDSSLGIAEVAYGLGNSVVTLSSGMNPDFMTSAATSPLPGYLPVDARDVHRALDAVDRDIQRLSPELFDYRILSGLSLGGLVTLFIAASEGEVPWRPFDVYVALDPPASLEHAAQTLDAFYNAPLAFEPQERSERIDELLAKVLYLSDGGLEPDMELPFRGWEAEFLIGLAFRASLQAVILQSQDLHDSGILKTRRTRWRRQAAFVEASEYSFLEYLYAFVLPYYAERLDGMEVDEAGARELLERSGLRAIEAGLRKNPDIRVFTNANDFLLREADLAWLRGVLDERLVVFPEGGHLGNLHRKGIQAAIEAIVVRAAREAEAAER